MTKLGCRAVERSRCTRGFGLPAAYRLRECAQRAPGGLYMRAQGAPIFFAKWPQRAPSGLQMRAQGAPALRRLSPPLRGPDPSRFDACPGRHDHQESSACRSTRCAPQSLQRSRQISGKIFCSCSRYVGVSRNRTSTWSSSFSAPR